MLFLYWSVPSGNYSRIVAMALLIGWAKEGFASWRLGRARGIAVALIAYLIRYRRERHDRS